jgi:hypothetical protein
MGGMFKAGKRPKFSVAARSHRSMRNAASESAMLARRAGIHVVSVR